MPASTTASYVPRDNKRALIYASDSPMREVEELCARIAQSDATVLLTGETGCGKEVIGRLVHQRSPRANKPFVPVNCAAIPESLLESELFGHQRGAFTGAATSRQGRVALAEGGTLFLDEIGELPLPMQAKILRLIQERVYEPVGGTRPIAANFRLVAATNRDLAEEVAAGRFRQDLYFRLLVCPVHLPPLRERRTDIWTLFQHFWAQRGETRKLSLEAIDLLQSYDWPGNVRELENLIERLSVCTRGERLEVSDLPANIRGVEVLLDLVASKEIEEQERAAEERALRRQYAMQEQAQPPEFRQQPNYFPQPQLVPLPENPLPQGLRLAPPLAPAFASPPAPAFAPPSAPAFASPPAFADGPAPLRPPMLAAANRPPPPTGGPVLPIDLPAMLRAMEDSYIAAALAESGGNKALAATMLGMQRTTLTEKLRRRAAAR